MEVLASFKIIVKLSILDLLLKKSLLIEARGAGWINWAKLVGEGGAGGRRAWIGWNPGDVLASPITWTLSSSEGIEGNSWLPWGSTRYTASCKKKTWWTVPFAYWKWWGIPTNPSWHLLNAWKLLQHLLYLYKPRKKNNCHMNIKIMLHASSLLCSKSLTNRTLTVPESRPEFLLC